MGSWVIAIKKWSMRRLGIPEVKANTKYEEERKRRDDGLFFDSLFRLVSLVGQDELEVQHLDSRHHFFMAVLEAGPYAIITSIVALSWAVAFGQSVALPAGIVAALVIVTVIGFNRLDLEVESALVNAKLNLGLVRERHAFRDAEVKEALLDYNASGKLSYFSAGFPISFRAMPELKDMVRGWMPEQDREVARNLQYKHPGTCELMKSLEADAWAYFDGTERFFKRVSEIIGSEIKEGEREATAWGLLFCMTHRIGSVEAVQTEAQSKRISDDEARRLRYLFDHGNRVYLSDDGLKQMSSEVEGQRASCESLVKAIAREIAILYGTPKRQV